MRAGRGVGWLAALLCAVPPVAPVMAGGGGCPHRLEVFLVRRVGAAARPIRLSVAGDPASDVSTVFVVTVRGRGARRVVPDDGLYVAMILYTGRSTRSLWPVVYTSGGRGGEQPVSPPAVTTPEDPPDGGPCDLNRQYDSPWPLVSETEPTTDDFIVGAYDTDVRLDVSPGWTVTPLPGGSMRMIVRQHAGSTGVQAGEQVEYFRGTPAVPGGRWGSVAYASLPCATTHPPARSGVGAGTLYGGGPPVYGSQRTMTCDPSDRDFSIGGSSGPTSWRVAGEAAGRPGENRRLVVFDLPPT